MRASAAAVGAGTVGAGSITYSTDEAEAIAPIVAAGYVGAAAAGAVGGALVGWALREYEILGSNPPPEGLTADALIDRVYTTARTRYSTNASSFIDNQNIIIGIDHAAHTDGKLEAIEALNEQDSQNDVQNAAIAAVDEYETTVLKNLLENWNESAIEIGQMGDLIDEHSDVHESDLFESDYRRISYEPDKFTYELADGTDFDLHGVYKYDTRGTGNSGGGWYAPFNEEDDPDLDYAFGSGRIDFDLDGYEDFTYLQSSEWENLITEIEDTFDSVRDGLILWVDNVYGQVQAGDIEISDLLTSRELAELMSDDEDYPQAVADLVALNIPVDLEREATIEIPAYDATLHGTLGVTDDEATIEVGETYDPDDIGSVFFTYDISEGHGDWTAYEEGIDGGTVTFTSEPYDETEYHIHTTAGEVAVVTTGDFEADAESAEWTVDTSAQLDNAITEIDYVDYFAQVDSTQYETIRIRDEFEVLSFEDADGNEYDEADFTRSEPQSDDNYITQDEWDEMYDQQVELIEKYEDAQNGSGGVAGGGSFDDRTLIGAALVGLAALLAAVGLSGGSGSGVTVVNSEGDD